MAMLFVQGAEGSEVKAIRTALVKAMGADAKAFPLLAQGAVLDRDAEAAIRQWQSAMGLQADGVIGPHALALLGLRKDPPLAVSLSLERVRPLFPNTKPANIARMLPYVLSALRACGLSSGEMVVAALATIRVQAEAFLPMSEPVNVLNTPPGRAPFSGYDDMLGNTQPGDGARYRGRGYLPLRGKAQYVQFGKLLELDLLHQPELANMPEVAATVLARPKPVQAPSCPWSSTRPALV